MGHMSAAILTTSAIRPAQPAKGPALGLGLSLAVHAAVLAWLVHAYQQPAPPAPPAKRIQVTLQRPKPPEVVKPVQVEPLPVPVAKTPARPAPAARAAEPSRAPSKPRPQTETLEPARPVIASPSAESPVTAAPLPEQPDAKPSTFDPAAARASALAFDKAERLGRGGGHRPRQEIKRTRDEKLGEAIDRSRPADCRSAYAGLGVLAVIPLAVDAVREGGCKW